MGEPISKVALADINDVSTTNTVGHHIDFMLPPLAGFDPLGRTLCLKKFMMGQGGVRLFLGSYLAAQAGLSEHRLGLTKTYGELVADALRSKMEVEPIKVGNHRRSPMA